MISARDPEEQYQAYQALLDDLGLSGPFSVEEFVAALSAKREKEVGRPLTAIAYCFPPASVLGERVTGMWVATADADFVFYDERAAPLLQKQIIFHEIAHLIEGHEALAAPEAMSEVFADCGIDPELVRHMFRRTDFTSREEAEAESGGTLLLAASTRPAALRPGASERGARALAGFQQFLAPRTSRPRTPLRSRWTAR